MNCSFFNLKKALLTSILAVAVLYCSAQKPLLSYQDFQYLTQNDAAAVTTFLQQKDYHLQSSSNGNIRLFGLIADEDYNDIDISIRGKHTTVILTTTDLPQVEAIKNSLQSYSYKNTKNGKLYRVKDSAIATLNLKEPANTEKTYVIQFEN